jgi:hypothetical protein
MAELKTKPTTQSVEEYLMQITDETTRKDCQTICSLMENVTKEKAKMWGGAIIGTGDYKYLYKSGKTLDWFMMGFSPRKANISLYIMGCTGKEKEVLLSRLGKHTKAKSCVYVKKLSDINLDVLKEMCEVAYQNLKK